MANPAKGLYSMSRRTSCEYFMKKQRTESLLVSARFCLIAAALGALILAGRTPSAQRLAEAASEPNCAIARDKINLAFLIDASGSMKNQIDFPANQTASLGRGQSYNVEIRGVIRALASPGVI